MGDIKTKTCMPWCRDKIKLLCERGNRGGLTNVMRKGIPNSGSVKSRVITGLFDRNIE